MRLTLLIASVLFCGFTAHSQTVNTNFIFNDWYDIYNEDGCAATPFGPQYDFGPTPRTIPAYPNNTIQASHGALFVTGDSNDGGDGLLFVTRRGTTTYSTEGAGIVIKNTFTKGRTYKITIKAKVRDALWCSSLSCPGEYPEPLPHHYGVFPTLQIQVTNNPNTTSYTKCNFAPAVDISQTTNPYFAFTTNAVEEKVQTFTFTPSVCYNYLWLSAFPGGTPGVENQGTISLHELDIEETTVNPVINGDSYICSGSKTYTLSSLPAGGPVNWVSSPSGKVSITTSPNGLQATVTRVTDGIVTIQAVIPNYTCAGASLIVSKTITVGLPPIIPVNPEIEPCGYGVTTFTTSVPGAYKYIWNLDSYQMETQTNFINLPSLPALPGQPPFPLAAGSHQLKVRYHNFCGTSAYPIKPPPYTFSTTTCTPTLAAQTAQLSTDSLVVSPNPSRDVINIEMVSQNTKTLDNQGIKKVIISDKLGNKKKQWVFNDNAKKQRLNIHFLSPDVYTLSVFDGTTWRSVKVMVK